MISKCEDMKLGYGASMFGLTEVYLLILLATQNICAHPYRNGQNERNAVKILDNEGRFQRDTWSYAGTDTSNGSTKILNSRNQQKGSSHRDRERVHSTSDIVFPEEVNKVPSCRGSTYCENVDFYPEDVVNRAIQRNNSLKVLAAVDEASIEERFEVGDVSLCRSAESVIYPQSAENKYKEWKFIANQENFKQGVRIERCLTENSTCQTFGGLAAGYKTICKQKYVYRQLASVLTDGTVVPDNFLLPASCCCHVIFTNNPLIRMDTSIENSTSQVKSFGMPKKK